MSAIPDPLNESGTPVPVAPVSIAIILAEAKRLTSLVRQLLEQVTTSRRERPWVALVVVPLGILAATVSLNFWIDIPLVVAAWWWGPREEQFLWLLGVMEGAFGVQWAFIGAYSLAAFPEHRILVGLLWILYAGAVAGIGMVNRRRFNRRYAW